MNPIFALEWRSRWRDKRSFWLLFALCALMALMVGFVYSQQLASINAYGDDFYGSSRRARSTGRELFQVIAVFNGLAWLIVAPVLAATPIARERERGLLESIQLSQMKPRSQMLARFGAHLLFLAALQFICLPVYGIAIALGGIGPAEIASAMLCLLVIAVFGIGLGMWISARAYRPTAALFVTIAVVLLWSVGIVLYLNGSFGIYPRGFWLNLPVCLHPIGLLYALLTPPSINLGVIGAKPFVIYAPYVVSFHLALLAVFLLDSARMGAKSFPPPAWQARNSMVARWKARIEAGRAIREQQQKEHDAREKVAGALVTDLPLEKLVRFKNPVLAREVKARFRLRRASFLVNLLRAVVFLCGAGLWLYAGYCLLDPLLTDDVPTLLLLGLWFGGSAFIALTASSSFIREVESGTWEGLNLSLLTTREILFAKLTSGPIAFLYYTLPLWLIVPFLMKTVFPFSLLLAVCVMFSAFALASAVGLYCSRRNRTTVAATCWTFGLLALLWGGLPALTDSIGVGRFIFDMQLAMREDADEDESRSNINGYSYNPNPYYYGEDPTRYYNGAYDLINLSPPALLSNLSVNKLQDRDYNPYESLAAKRTRMWKSAAISCFIAMLLTLFLRRELLYELDERGKKSLLGISLGRLSRGSRLPSRPASKVR